MKKKPRNLDDSSLAFDAFFVIRTHSLICELVLESFISYAISILTIGLALIFVVSAWLTKIV